MATPFKTEQCNKMNSKVYLSTLFILLQNDNTNLNNNTNLFFFWGLNATPWLLYKQYFMFKKHQGKMLS